MAQKYKTDYFKHYGITEADVLICKCGKVATSLHHKIPKSLGGTDHYSNLEPVCFDCHYKIHNG